MKKEFTLSLDRLADLLSDGEAGREAAMREGGIRGARSRWDAHRRRQREAHKRKGSGGVRGLKGGGYGIASRKLPLAGWKVLIARAEPGCWYARGELADLIPEYVRRGVWLWLADLVRRGLLEKGLNADFDESRPLGRQLEPRYLYRLTEAGEAARADWRRFLRSARRAASRSQRSGGE